MIDWGDYAAIERGVEKGFCESRGMTYDQSMPANLFPLARCKLILYLRYLTLVLTKLSTSVNKTIVFTKKGPLLSLEKSEHGNFEMGSATVG